FIYFISSRSRNTRSKRDWSSDVCSSDLIDTIHHIQAGACIPSDHDGGCVIHTSDRTLCSNRRRLLIIHLDEFHTASNRIGFSYTLNRFFIRKSHSWHLL